MSRINQYVVAMGTFSVALGIGFVMQNGDALAARFTDTPSTAMPATVLPALQASARPAPREGTAAWMVRQRIDAGVTDDILAAAAARAATGEVGDAMTLTIDPVVEAAATAEVMPALPEIAPMDAPLPVALGLDEAVTSGVSAEAPVLEAALDTDVVPAVPAPEALSPAPDCGVTLEATVLPVALVELALSAPCSPSARATIHHNGMIFTVVTDAAGAARVTVPALAEGAVFMADLGDAGGAVAAATVTDVNDFDRAVLQWQGDVGPEIHALEFGARYGEPGHVWHGAPGAADLAIAGTGGFLMRLGDGLGLNPQMAEVYTFPSATTQQSGQVAFTIETPVTDATCGRDLAAQTIQVSPGAEPFAFDLTMAVPGCDFVGEILVLKDMIYDLTLAAR
jgi:hypothetical protein